MREIGNGAPISTEIASCCLSAALQEMPDDDALRHLIPVVPTPAQLVQHGREVASVTQAGIALAIFLENRQRQFGQVIGGDILYVATLDTGLDWSPGVAIEAESSGYTNRFHTGLPHSRMLRCAQHDSGV